MQRPRIVSRDEWTAERKQLLQREKEFTHQRDALSAARRELPCVKVEKDYVFVGPDGRASLRDLFEGRRQLIVYHFMFDPSWEQGCKSCSFLADGFDGAAYHLPARDVTLVAVSRAPIEKLSAFKARMGWRFPWYSSAETDFNYDYHVSFRQDDVDAGAAEYNYEKASGPISEAPGLSAFLRDGDDVLHTYSAYARGLDALVTTYNVLDLAPLGRNEEGLPHTMSWVRHHDKYDAR
jgi:predicted dithiol-disulfide oxidoreductase (DUF899 family)